MAPSTPHLKPADGTTEPPALEGFPPLWDARQEQPRIIQNQAAEEDDIYSADDVATPRLDDYTITPDGPSGVRSPFAASNDAETELDNGSRTIICGNAEDEGNTRQGSPEGEVVIHSMSPRTPRPAQPRWREATRNSRRRSTGGIREEIFVKNAD